MVLHFIVTATRLLTDYSHLFLSPRSTFVCFYGGLIRIALQRVSFYCVTEAQLRSWPNLPLHDSSKFLKNLCHLVPQTGVTHFELFLLLRLHYCCRDS